MKNESVTKVLNKVSNKAGRVGLKIQKYSPEIALYAGIGGVICAAVVACRQTTKSRDIIVEHHEKLNQLQTVIDLAEDGTLENEGLEYDTDVDTKRDKVIIYSQTAMAYVKLYAPAIMIGGLSIAAILWSHGIMRKRYLGVLAAYNALNEAFNTYRERVKAEGGDALDRHYMFGTKMEKLTEETIDENGKKKKETNEVEVESDKTSINEFTRIWGPGESKYYDANNAYSWTFLRAQNEYFNTILNSRGHLFLNEVLDALGYKQTAVGAVTGWVKGEKGKDGYVDIGIYNDQVPEVRSYIDRKTKLIPLTFNVDGVILDLI